MKRNLKEKRKETHFLKMAVKEREMEVNSLKAEIDKFSSPPPISSSSSARRVPITPGSGSKRRRRRTSRPRSTQSSSLTNNDPASKISTLRG